MRKHVYISRIADLLQLKSSMRGAAITIQEFAASVEVSRQTVYTWMDPNGVNALPSADKQARLNAYFGVEWYEMWKLAEQHDPAPVR